MTPWNLCIEQCFRLPNMCRQDVGRHPESSVQNAVNCQRQLRLPLPVKFHETVYARVEKLYLYLFRTIDLPWREEHQNLAAWELGAAPRREPPDVGLQ